MINIDDKTQCCGCSSCSSACPKKCINMIEDEEGFLYPQINREQCIECGLCEKVCPILNYEKRECNLEQKAAIVQHKNEEILRQSTAGGAFTAIAEYVINNGGVVFGVEMTDEYKVRHTYVEKKEDLYKFRNSKYVQSDTENTYSLVKSFLEQGRIVCFSGTPCQIEGLRHFLRREYDNLILVDVVCRAVPSPGVWKKYIQEYVHNNGELSSIRFRDKSLGYQYSTMEIKCKSGKIDRGGIESQLWLRMFFSGMIIRPSCTECKFRNQYRNSDFTIWDCFNVRDIDKEFDEDCGTTRVLIHSEKAYKIFQELEDKIIYKMIDPKIIVEGVDEIFKSPKEHILRKQFFEDAKIMKGEKLFNKYFSTNIQVKLKKYIRLGLNRLGLDKMVKRVLRKIRKK